MYLKRHISDYISRMRKQFKVLLLTGPRQVGKSTMLSHMFASDYNYVVLDDYLELETAKNDPGLFFKKVMNCTVLVKTFDSERESRF